MSPVLQDERFCKAAFCAVGDSVRRAGRNFFSYVLKRLRVICHFCTKTAKFLRADLRPRKILEDEVTATQRPQHLETTQGPPHRYPIPLQLRYRARSRHGTLHGFGQARMMSSKDIIFAPGDGLNPGMKAEIAVAWPFLLDGHIRLQLVLEATIISSQDGVAEARILAYHFRTRGPAEDHLNNKGTTG